MLSQTLRHLERDGPVVRRAFDERPLRVEYELSATGRELLPIVKRFKRWAETHVEEVAKSDRMVGRVPRPLRMGSEFTRNGVMLYLLTIN